MAGSVGAVAGRPSRGLNPRQMASVLSRFQGPEQLYIQPFTPLDQPVIPTNLNLTRPCSELILIWKGRVSIGGANYTAVAAEAPQTIIQRVQLTGTHKTFNQIMPINMTGATIWAWPLLYKSRGNALIINGVQQPAPGVPFAQVGSVFGNTGDYDLIIEYRIPFAPVYGPWSKRVTNYYALNPQDWVGQSLQLQLFMGDLTSFGTPAGGTTVAFHAFGSSSGSPVVGVYQNFLIQGPAAGSIASGVVIRNEQNVISGSLGQIGNQIRLALLQKQQTSNVVLKTGIQLAGTSGQVVVFGSLSDSIAERTQLIVDNKPVKNNPLNILAKLYAGDAFNCVIPGGYLLFPFDESQTPLTSFQAQTSAGGTVFELDSDVLTNTSGQLGTFVQEQLLGAAGQKAA